MYTKKPPILSTLKDIRKIKKLSFLLHCEKHFEIVHCRSYISSIIGLKMKQKYGVKFIFDMRGFWADERVEGGLWNISKIHYKLVYNFFKKKEKQFLNNADAIVSLTHNAKQIMIKDWAVLKPIYVIPCAVDTLLFKPFHKRKTKQSLILGYLGSIGTWYMLDEMLDFFNFLLKKYPKAKFKFITNETPATIVNKAKVRDIDVEHFEIVPVNRKDVPKELSKIDIGIFFIRPTFSKQSSSPVKQGEFMAMGIPVITNSGVGDIDDIMNKYKSGILINDFTESEYISVINKLESILDLNKVNIVKGADEYFSLEKGIGYYNQLYNDL